MMLKRPSHSWWFDSHNSPRRSLWLQSTLADLDEKTKAMLKLIEEDADSFAQRAEMYYKKRPELVNMVEDFYRAHRSLAEKYEALRTETGTRSLAMQLGSPFFNKCPPRSLKATLSDKCSVASCDSFESEVSEVDDPDQEESQVGAEVGEDVSSEEIGGQGIRCGDNIASFEGKCLVQSGESESKGEIAEKNIALAIRPVCFSMRERELSDEVLKLREEIVQLKDDNAMQKAGLQRRDERRKCEAKIQWENAPEVFGMGTSVDDQMLRLRQELKQLKEELETQKEELSGRNEEKREAIRQLCLSMEMLKEENACLKKYVKDVNKKKSSFEFSKFRGLFTGKVFTKMFQPSIVAL